ncbi:hypothetical protein PHLCEN_2v13148 [Hermanssonia centrifuga]|uniref:Uncharacterized protein n=1 Tax=Hermanssonia centrifuga TaxID=98765 RepID=A0A2R6NG63_9APHY|nr:hypothetical protein PHLCEN_2v13148 [Hermanssonia centrifuga]
MDCFIIPIGLQHLNKPIFNMPDDILEIVVTIFRTLWLAAMSSSTLKSAKHHCAFKIKRVTD